MLGTVSGIGVVLARLRVTVSVRMSPVTITLVGTVTTLNRIRVRLVSTSVRAITMSSPITLGTISVRAAPIGITNTLVPLGRITVSPIPARLSISTTLSTVAVSTISIILDWLATPVSIRTTTIADMFTPINRIAVSPVPTGFNVTPGTISVSTFGVRTVSIGIMSALTTLGRVIVGLVSTRLGIASSPVSTVLSRLTVTVNIRMTSLSVSGLASVLLVSGSVTITTSRLLTNVVHFVLAPDRLRMTAVRTVPNIRLLTFSAPAGIVAALGSTCVTVGSRYRLVGTSTRGIGCARPGLAMTGSLCRLTGISMRRIATSQIRTTGASG